MPGQQLPIPTSADGASDSSPASGAALRTDAADVSAISSFAFQHLIAALPGAYLILSPELIIQAVSDAYLQATLTERSSLIGRYVFDVFPDNPEAPEAKAVQNLRASFQQVVATGQPHRIPLQHYDVPDPAHPARFVERYWRPLNTPVLDGQGQVSYIIHSVENVTDYVKTQEQLRTSQGKEQEALAEVERQRPRLATFLMQAPTAVCVLAGPQLVYELVNLLYQQFFPDRKLLGRPLLDAVPELAGHGVVEVLQRVYETGKVFEGKEIALPPIGKGENAPQEEIYWNFICQPRRDERGQIDAVVVFSYDVTEQVRTRQKLEQFNAELEAQVAYRTQEVKAAQAEAEAQRTLLHNMFMQAPAMIAILKGPDHIFQLVNPLYQQLVGQRRLLGRSIREAMPELKEQPIFGLLDEVYDTGRPFHASEMLVQLDHTNSGVLGNNYYNFIYEPTRDVQGAIDGVLIFAYDVTAQVQARQQTYLLNSELAAANEELAAANEEMTATNDELRTAYADLDLMQFALRQLNEDLEARVASRTAELAAAQVQAENQRKQLHTLFEQAPVAIAIFRGRDFVIELANPAVCHLVGRTPEQVVSKPLFDALPEMSHQGIDQILDGVLRTGAPHVAHERPSVLYRKGQRTTVYWNFVYHPLRDHTGHVSGVILVATDVSEQVQARRQLARTNEELLLANHEIRKSNEGLAAANFQLTRVNVDLDNFIYTASHDLKAPIANIEGLLQALQQQLPPASLHAEAVTSIISMMQNSVERFQKTLANLTEITKLQKENDQPMALVNLAEVVEEVRLDLTPLIEETNARLDVDVAACPTVSFAEKNLRSVVYNLLSNALKYRHPDRAPRVRIYCWPEEEFVALAVEDNGLGLELSPERPLFAMFRRFHDHVEGSGIGLYMVKKMVENAGGHIQVQSQLNHGSTFTVYFRR